MSWLLRIDNKLAQEIVVLIIGISNWIRIMFQRTSLNFEYFLNARVRWTINSARCKIAIAVRENSLSAFPLQIPIGDRSRISDRHFHSAHDSRSVTDIFRAAGKILLQLLRRYADSFADTVSLLYGFCAPSYCCASAPRDFDPGTERRKPADRSIKLRHSAERIPLGRRGSRSSWPGSLFIASGIDCFFLIFLYGYAVSTLNR